MILLFGEKAHKTNKNSNIKNHPVENSGVLAMNNRNSRNIFAFDRNEYDTYEFSTQSVIDYTMFGTEGYSEVAFLSNFSDAISTLGDCVGFSSSSFSSCDCGCSGSCGSFSSMC